MRPFLAASEDEDGDEDGVEEDAHAIYILRAGRAATSARRRE